MKKLTTLFFLFSIISSCTAAKSFIKISSVDNSQNVELNIGEINTFEKSKINPENIEDDSLKGFNLNDISSLLLTESYENHKVLYLTKELENREGEVQVSILIELENDSLSKLFLMEIGEIIWYWEKDKAEVEISDGKTKIKAILKSMGFALSEIIQFNTNDSGGYDDKVRYLRLESEFIIDKD